MKPTLQDGNTRDTMEKTICIMQRKTKFRFRGCQFIQNIKGCNGKLSKLRAPRPPSRCPSPVFATGRPLHGEVICQHKRWQIHRRCFHPKSRGWTVGWLANRPAHVSVVAGRVLKCFSPRQGGGVLSSSHSPQPSSSHAPFFAHFTTTLRQKQLVKRALQRWTTSANDSVSKIITTDNSTPLCW